MNISRKKGRLIFERWGDNHIRNMIFNFLKIMNTLSRKIKIDFWEMRWQLWQKGENHFFKIMSTFSRKMKIHLWEMRWHYVKKIKKSISLRLWESSQEWWKLVFERWNDPQMTIFGAPCLLEKMNIDFWKIMRISCI